MKEIRGDAKNLHTLLANQKFALDYYQREYSWEKEQVIELIDDLVEIFNESHASGNERTAVGSYGHYFLGSIIISDKNVQKFIIDGQQRLTTLTLLLVHLYHRIGDEDLKRRIANLIFSSKFDKRSFNLDIDERAPCMDAIFNGHVYDESVQPKSISITKPNCQIEI